MEKNKVRLLVVEDEKKLCDMIAKSLHQSGYEVDVCNDGEEALDMIYAEIGASTLARNKNYYKPQKCGLFYVKFYLFLCCTELYFIFICDIMRYETQL